MSRNAAGVAQAAVQADALAVLVEPAAQGRPLADQHLVGDLRRTLAQGHEPRACEPVEKCLDGVGRGALRHEVVDVHAPAGVLDALSELGQPQEEAAHQRALVGWDGLDQRVGGLGDSRADASALPVALDRQRPAVAPLPGRSQGMREKR